MKIRIKYLLDIVFLLVFYGLVWLMFDFSYGHNKNSDNRKFKNPGKVKNSDSIRFIKYQTRMAN